MSSILISTLGEAPDCMPEQGRRFMSVSTLRPREHCIMCNRQFVGGDLVRFDAYNNPCCSKHMPSVCSVCNRFIVGQRVKIPGYGYACTTCGTPRTYAELENIRRSINAFYQHLQMYIPGYRLVLLHGEAMAEKYLGEFDAAPYGAAWRDDGNPNYQYRIDVMSQQSVVSMANTLAHELMHLWQYHRHIEAPKAYSEGFCNLGAFLFIATLSRDEALVNLSRMMENPDPNYGVAFRRLKVLHDVYGWKAVVDAMKSYAVQ